MKRFSLLIVPIVLILGFLFFLLGSTGFLPLSFYTAYQNVLGFIPGGGATLPYMQKFEGPWSAAFVPSSSESDLGSCVELDGIVTMHNGTLSGTVGPAGSLFTIVASTSITGALTGKMVNSQQGGSLTATLAGGNGTGSWADSYGCQGSLTFTKEGAVVDPTQGRVVSYSGSAVLVRAGVPERLLVGEQLYAGDIIEVGDGSVFLALGPVLAPISKTIGSNSTFTVPIVSP